MALQTLKHTRYDEVLEVIAAKRRNTSDRRFLIASGPRAGARGEEQAEGEAHLFIRSSWGGVEDSSYRQPRSGLP